TSVDESVPNALERAGHFRHDEPLRRQRNIDTGAATRSVGRKARRGDERIYRRLRSLGATSGQADRARSATVDPWMSDASVQQAVFALLADPATHGVEKVERKQTHAAMVFLAGERAFKVKRAVRFPFLDYSTLEKRQRACEAELEVNRPFAPEIYHRVVAITREAAGRLALDGSGTAVEWAVEMRRFAENAPFDRLAAQGQIDSTLAEALGRTVAAAHRRMVSVAPEAWINALADYIEEHVAAFGNAADVFPLAAFDKLARLSRA